MITEPVNMNDDEIIRKLYEYGHFFSPNAKDFGITLKDLPALDIYHPAVKAALKSYQEFAYNELNIFAIKAHGRRAVPDGVPGPATRALLNTPRCEVPDYFASGDPRSKLGTGSWPMPCQKAGIKVYVDKSQMPSAITGQWTSIQKQVFEAYRLMGGKLIETMDKNEANIIVFFGSFFGSTIGLSEFNSQHCSDVVTCKLSNSYVGYNTGLLKHELGHNFNLNHTRGGTMNPFILPEADPQARWLPTDPSYETLVKFLGGEPVDDTPPDFPPLPPNPPPIPVPVPPAPLSFWERLLKLLGLR
jgi:hypothetical protein